MLNKLQLLIIFLLFLIFSSWSIAADLEITLASADDEIAAGDYDAARQLLDGAIKSSPQSSKAHQKLAALHMIQLEYSESVPLFQKAIGLDEKNGGAFLGLGFSYLHSGRYGPARAALLEAQSLIPDKTTEIQQVISWIDGRMQADQPDNAHAADVPENVKALMGHNKN